MDYKGIIFFVSSIFVGNFNEILQTVGLGANILYIAYQIYTHKKNDD